MTAKCEPKATDRCQRGREPVVRGDGSIEIPLTRGLTAIVSPESYPLVRDRTWGATPNANDMYATTHGWDRGAKRASTLRMSRLVSGADGSQCVDHVNHDTLDNRLCNLRVCSLSNNQGNRRADTRRKNKTSRFKGVGWHRSNALWRSRIGGRLVGYFKVEEDAARAYDAAARSEFGEFALLNFPEVRRVG